jgi:bifunctional non-homologous end joining protein LigD
MDQFAGSGSGLMAAKLEGAKGAPYPKFVEPSLATLVDRPPSGERWVHEIKFDGYRLQVHLKEGTAKFYTRRGYDWTPRFKHLASACGGLKLTAPFLMAR